MCTLYGIFGGFYGLIATMAVLVLLLTAAALLSRGAGPERDTAGPGDAPLSRCGHCGYLGTPKARYCGQCGAPLSESTTRP